MTQEHPYVAAFIFAALGFGLVWHGWVTRRTMLFPWFDANADENPGCFYAILTFFALFALFCIALGVAALTAAFG